MMCLAGPHVLAFDFGWGHLQHHDQPCDECDGSGVLDDEECYRCDGGGTLRWGSFYIEDEALCGYCRREDVPISDMYSSDDYDRQWVCLPCYVTHHREACGCARWGDAESAMSRSTQATEPKR